MYRDKNVKRVDLRIPIKMYEKLEKMAEEANMPFTPKTKNMGNPTRALTPVLLKLIELGLEVIEDDNSKLLQCLDNSQLIEDKIFKRLEKRLQEKVDEEAIKIFEKIYEKYESAFLKLSNN